MTDQLEHISSLVVQLKNRYEKSISARKKLLNENSKLKAEIAEIRQRLELLESYKKSKQVSATLSNDSTDRKEIRKTINNYIKEIDHCIATLSE